jgi:uncharacterized membrane protein
MGQRFGVPINEVDNCTFAFAMAGCIFAFVSQCEYKQGKKILFSLLLIFFTLIISITALSYQLSNLN